MRRIIGLVVAVSFVVTAASPPVAHAASGAMRVLSTEDIRDLAAPDDFARLAPHLVDVTGSELQRLLAGLPEEPGFDQEFRVVVGLTETVVVADVLRDRHALLAYEVVYTTLSRADGSVTERLRVRSAVEDGWIEAAAVGEEGPASRMRTSAFGSDPLCTGCSAVDTASDLIGGWRCLIIGTFFGCLLKAVVGEIVVGQICDVGPCASGHEGPFWQPTSSGCDQSGCGFTQWVKERRDGVPVSDLDSFVYWYPASDPDRDLYDGQWWSLSQYEQWVNDFRRYYWHHTSANATGSTETAIYLGVGWADGSFVRAGPERLPTRKPPSTTCPLYLACV